MRGIRSEVLPQARGEGIVVRELAGEVLVYDLDRHKAHCLSPTAALIWKQCDGESTVPQIARLLRDDFKIAADEEVVWVAVRRLDKAALLRERVAAPARSAHSSSRRELLQKVALLGGLSVLSILAPTAAEAATCNPVSCKHVFNKGCFENGRCCSNNKTCAILVDGGGTCAGAAC